VDVEVRRDRNEGDGTMKTKSTKYTINIWDGGITMGRIVSSVRFSAASDELAKSRMSAHETPGATLELLKPHPTFGRIRVHVYHIPA
jgi:hypothetical protein